MTGRRRKYFVWFGSERLHSKQERTRARRDLRRGIEPAPRYRTRKFWVD